MDNLAATIIEFGYYAVDAWDWLAQLAPDQYLRVFWAVVFLEIPRYAFANIYILYLYLGRTAENRRLDVFERNPPLVSIVVPSHNEQEIIGSTVASLAEQDYPNLEIIVVDDGSTDETSELLRELRRRPRVRTFRLSRRQGKSAALNFGLSVSKGNFVVFMDADSTLARDVVTNLIICFSQPDIGAVSGDLGVRNYQANLLTRLQALEYLISLSLGRRFKAEVGLLSIVPGAIGAFRRDLLNRIGGIEPGPGNDSDLTIRTRKLGMKVVFAGTATCLTTVPTSLRHWFKQRMRWDRNIIRNRARKHADIFNPNRASFNWSNFISFVDTFFFVAILPIVWLVYMVDIVIAYPGEYGYILIAVLFLHILLNFSRALIGLLITDRTINFRDIALAVPIYGIYRLLLKLVRILAITQELLFRSSYRDPFAPEKVRENMRVY